MRLVIRWKSRGRSEQPIEARPDEASHRVAGPVLTTPEMAAEATPTDPAPHFAAPTQEEIRPVIEPMMAMPLRLVATASVSGAGPGDPAAVPIAEPVRKQPTVARPEHEPTIKPRCRRCGSPDLWRWGRTKGWRLAVANALNKHWEQCRACGLRQMLPGEEGPPPDPIADLVRRKQEEQSTE